MTGGDVGSGTRWFKLCDFAGNDFSQLFITFVAAKQMNTVVDFEVFDIGSGSGEMVMQVYGW